MKTQVLLYWFVAILIGRTTAVAQDSEFSISGEAYNSRIGGIAFDGTNYLAGLSGDMMSDSNLTLQFFTQTGQLLGNRISLGETGSAPLVAFDGTNYLVVWADRYVSLNDDGEQAGMTNYHGRFINPAGTFTGSKFSIAPDAYIKGGTGNELHFNGSNYFFIYREEAENDPNNTGPIYGRFISTTGLLLGNPIRISSTPDADEISLGYDGANYLAVFSYNSKYIYGQFISTSGVLVESNFVIDNSENHSDNPVWVAWGGGKYLVAFHDDNTLGLNPDPQWNIFARFVSTSGIVDPDKITISDYLQDPIAATVAFDGTNFLTSWHSLNTQQLKGRFWSPTGLPVGEEFVIFNTLSGTMPIGGLYLHSGNDYLAVCTRITWPLNVKSQGIVAKSALENTNLGIYGKFIDDKITSIEIIEDDGLVQIYPNPATDVITLNTSFDIIGVTIYRITGELVFSKLICEPNQQIGVGFLNPGVFIVEIKTARSTERQKLAIQK